MKNLFILLGFLTIGVLNSCDSKDSELKKVLKEDALTRGEEYELLEYRLVESVLISTINDSISSIQSSISAKEWKIEADSTRLISLYAERRDCVRKKATTIPSLVYTWNNLIKDYDKMIREAEDDIQIARNRINGYNKKIEYFNHILTYAEDPIAYYIYYHCYKLDGKVCEDEIKLTTKKEILK